MAWYSWGSIKSRMIWKPKWLHKQCIASLISISAYEYNNTDSCRFFNVQINLLIPCSGASVPIGTVDLGLHSHHQKIIFILLHIPVDPY